MGVPQRLLLQAPPKQPPKSQVWGVAVYWGGSFWGQGILSVLNKHWEVAERVWRRLWGGGKTDTVKGGLGGGGLSWEVWGPWGCLGGPGDF